MSQLDSMTDQQVRDLIRSFEPHEEHGEPMVTCHYDLWRRVVELTGRCSHGCTICTPVI